MTEKCTLNIYQDLKDLGLSDDALDGIMGELDANNDNIRRASGEQKLKMIGDIFAKTKVEAAKTKLRKGKDLEKSVEIANRGAEYIDKDIPLDRWVPDTADGNLVERVSGVANGYTTVAISTTHRLQDKVQRGLQDALAPLEDGTPDNTYLDMWAQLFKKPDKQAALDIAKELQAYNNAKVTELQGEPYTGPAPGHTGNTFAGAVAKVLTDVMLEHNDVLAGYGMNSALILDYILPQKHFADLMTPNGVQKTEAFIVGYTSKNDGKTYRGMDAIKAMKADYKRDWLNFVKSKLDVKATMENMQKIAYAEIAGEIKKFMELAASVHEVSPITARLIQDAIQSNRTAPQQLLAVMFEGHIPKKHLSWKERLEYVVSHSKSEKHIAVAKILLNDNNLFNLLSRRALPADPAPDLDTVLSNIYESIVNPIGHLGTFNTLGKNQYQRAALERVLVFDGPEAWVDYQHTYGHGNIAHAVNSMLTKFGKAEAYAKVFGSNARATVAKAQDILKIHLTKKRDAATSDIEKGRWDDKLAQLNKTTQQWELYIDYIEGVFDLPSNSPMQRILTSTLMLGRLRLGQAIFPAMGDFARRFDALNQVGLASGLEMATPFRPLVKTLQYLNFKLIKRIFSNDQARVHSFYGMFQGMPGRLSTQGMPEVSQVKSHWFYTARQQVNKGMDAYLSATLITQFDEANRAGVADQIGTYLGNVAADGGRWSDLSKPLRDYLKMANIGEAEWDIYRKYGVYKYGKNRENWALSAWQIEKSLPDEVVVDYLVTHKGIDESNITDMLIRQTKRNLISAYDEFIVAFANTAVVTPNLQTRAFLQGGASVNDPWRAVRALFTEFLSYPTRILFDLHRSLAYDFSKNGAGKRAGVLRLAKLAVAGYITGYMGMTLKDIANGREPKNPLDVDTVIAALTLGGTLGLVGETALETYEMRSLKELYRWLGPTGTQLLDMGDLALSGVKGELEAQKVLDVAYRQAPNLIWTKWLFDKYFFAELYKFFGADYARDVKQMRTDETYGTIGDFLQLFTND